MGYTHYYEQKRSFTDAEWSIIVKGWKLISKEAKIYVDDQSELAGPRLKQYFDINGFGDDGHENFVLEKKKVFMISNFHLLRLPEKNTTDMLLLC